MSRTVNMMLADEATARICSILNMMGLKSDPTPDNERFDLTVKNGSNKRLRVEIKASRWRPYQNGSGRYQANLRDQHEYADFFILALSPGEWVDWWFLIIPAREVETRTISLYSRHPLPGVCKSRVTDGLGRWDLIKEALHD